MTTMVSRLKVMVILQQPLSSEANVPKIAYSVVTEIFGLTKPTFLYVYITLGYKYHYIAEFIITNKEVKPNPLSAKTNHSRKKLQMTTAVGKQ